MADSEYLVQEGDCISSLAQRNGLKWQALWNHNPELKKLRKNPNALQPGDVVLIPSRELRYENRSTDQKHTFVRSGVPAKFRLILERFDEPLANKHWTLSVDGQLHSGITNAQGLLEISLSPEAVSGHLVVAEENLEYDLSFGSLDPSDTVSGAQARLENLGFLSGGVSGELDDQTRDAILLFQTAHGLTATGELDEQTLDELERRHDNVHAQPSPESNSPPAETAGEDDELPEPEISEQEDERRFQQFDQLDDEEE